MIKEIKEPERNKRNNMWSSCRDIVIGVDQYVDCVEVSDVRCNMGLAWVLVFMHGESWDISSKIAIEFEST
jgi:hypothetical protein